MVTLIMIALLVYFFIISLPVYLEIRKMINKVDSLRIEIELLKKESERHKNLIKRLNKFDEILFEEMQRSEKDKKSQR